MIKLSDSSVVLIVDNETALMNGKESLSFIENTGEYIRCIEEMIVSLAGKRNYTPLQRLIHIHGIAMALLPLLGEHTVKECVLPDILKTEALLIDYAWL